jgi:dynein heavy chain
MFAQLYELQPKDTDTAAAGDVKTNVEIATDVLKYILEDMGMKGLIFNLEDIKTKIDADSKGPYQNVFL